MNIGDVLKTNLVLIGVRLLNTPDARAKFDDGVGTDVSETGVGITLNISVAPLPVGPTQLELGQTLTLNRDRITLELTPDRTTINRDYPSKDDLARLAEVAALAIKSSDTHNLGLRAVGFNIDVVYEQTTGLTALSFLVGRVFVPKLFQSAGYQLQGGAARLHLLRGEQVWNINIEPRFNNPESTKVYASFNLHRDTKSLPQPDHIKASLEEVWDQAYSIVKSLDEGI